MSGLDAPISVESADGEERTEEGATCFILGEDIIIDTSEGEVVVQCKRLRQIENISPFGNSLRKLCLISAGLQRIEGLKDLVALEHLELYQNQIRRIENLEYLADSLKTLDLSFNQIHKIENISTLRKLERLYLPNNKISDIKGLDSLTALRVLELGANRIRRIENIETLVSLEELWLGKQKIARMCVLANDEPSKAVFNNVRILSLQSNRITQWELDVCQQFPNLNGLYLGQNRVGLSEGRSVCESVLGGMKSLEELDLAGNECSYVPSFDGQCLEELWMNDNNVRDFGDTCTSLKGFGHIRTVYLERNPIQVEYRSLYRKSIMDACSETLEQIDATPIPAELRQQLRREDQSNSKT